MTQHEPELNYFMCQISQHSSFTNRSQSFDAPLPDKTQFTFSQSATQSNSICRLVAGLALSVYMYIALGLHLERDSL